MLTNKVLQEKLETMGFTMGHEPDSAEFSTLGTSYSLISSSLLHHLSRSFFLTYLGGWISTRASGMKKNTYGNIEDILVSARLVTPTGVLHRDLNAPRISSGPDVNEVFSYILFSLIFLYLLFHANKQIILGSEGTYGIITDAVVKIQPLPR